MADTYCPWLIRALLAGLLILAGCASTRVAEQDAMFKAEAAVDTDVDTKIGGDGDSITGWLAVGGQALVAIALVAALLLVLQRRRLKREKRERNGERDGPQG